MPDEAPKPFAHHGSEKMVYDVRMGPQALCCNDVIYIAYQANADGPEAHPHLITHDLREAEWSRPVQVGQVAYYDHHLAPILWFDCERHVHVLYKCDARDGGVHLISTHPESIDEWTEGPEIYPSLSYPRVVRIGDGKLLLYYHVFGHMGFWTYQVSSDGGYSWTRAHTPLVDFDQQPRCASDTWAGSYQSVCASRDGRSLHIAFVHWDERRAVNPLYKRRLDTINRYHLYYLRLDIASGALYTIEGDRIETPVTRQRAEQCKVWDTGHRLTNMPSILVDGNDEPCFLMPVSEGTPWECQFYFIRRKRGEWERQAIVRTNHTWSGSHLAIGEGGTLVAHLVVGSANGEPLAYGGGQVNEWISVDQGVSWDFNRKLASEPGLLYNNPRPVERIDGSEMPGFLVFFGWEGPGGLQRVGPSLAPLRNTGRAYLWHDGEWL